MQFQVVNSPFSREQADLLNQLMPTLTDKQILWLSGYLSASALTERGTDLQKALKAEGSVENRAPVPQREITILYGTDTGNAQQLAEEFTVKLKEQKLSISTYLMDDFKPKAIQKVEDLLIITSTHGDGDPPDNAVAFYDFLHSTRAPRLDGLRYSILALGDSSYEFFCKTGKDFDKRLEELGAERILPRVECDLDFEDPANQWMEDITSKVLDEHSNSGEVGSTTEVVAPAMQKEYSKKNPFHAEIVENINLNGRGSNKETRHLVLDLEGSNLHFEPGDSLGIVPTNHPMLVDQIINKMGFNPDEQVLINKDGELDTVRNALLSTYEITKLTKPLIEKLVDVFENQSLKELLGSNREELNQYLEGRDVLDLVQDFGPWEATASEFISVLRKLPSRLYSIASSCQANPDEVHLTVGTVRFKAHGRDRIGVCSGKIAEQLEVGDKIPVYVQRNKSFRLPEDPSAPIIMIGAGTGIAPYRSFLEEREELGVTGETWLFFGEQHFMTDFLYQVEWQRWLKSGVLSKMDVAFSRDTVSKIYVQHRMLEKSLLLYEWLENGAYLYVCGDEKHMAKDVHQTLLTIIEKEGGKTKEEAEEFLVTLRKEKRYQRDVY
ncbi:assimilatory sulfite reductase (NADPH) flavoprotein subunit [Radiobacillus kanasensis]|uniref:assimilatory sulfite reductase (NADPH) flavoprotein subunit n=1 Tax=Radiobacillus kanasensis TaxID=2844358 RepID=UPI001E43C41C|nr:assimilatory sulfite reductase (NADPH) flavoprotein subunit [Radiobacillus kanasensis]UFT98050.1 assimilatory sulfite reductase (NADPH) flavoprotein subunit [Radiobacillus kanasensis]